MAESHASRYRLAEQKHNSRLAEFRTAANLTSLQDEIALARTLIEDRINSASTPAERAGAMMMVRDLLGVLANLTKAHHAQAIQTGETLEKRALFELSRDVVKIVADELAGIPDYEDRLTRIASRLADSIGQASNNQPKETN